MRPEGTAPPPPPDRLKRGGVIGWTARHPVLPNLVMLILLIGGLLTIGDLRKQLFPDYEVSQLSVIMTLPGATAEEMAEAVTDKVEDAVAGLAVWDMQSWTRDGKSEVYFHVRNLAERGRVLAEVQQAVASIEGLPEDIDPPLIRVQAPVSTIAHVQVHGDVDPLVLRRAAELVRDRLEAEEGISRVAMRGASDHELAIEVPRAVLRATGLTIEEIAATVRRATQTRAGGQLDTGRGELLLTVEGRLDGVSAFENLTLTAEDGRILRLGEIATIRRTFAANDSRLLFDGEPAISLRVQQHGDETPSGISEATARAVAEVQRVLPRAIGVTVSKDRSLLFEDRVWLLVRNGAVGLLLVLVLLSLFLEVRLAFWVAVGIPTAFLGTFLLLPAAGVSLNLVSLFAFILALGLVVDDAIVAGENIYEYRERGLDRVEAAVQGARDIAVPLSFSIITNIIAFLPLALVPGWFGRFWVVIPIVVAAAFVISWLEALFVLPGHLASVRERPKGRAGVLERVRSALSAGLANLVARVYVPLLGTAISWRYTTIALMIALLVVTIAYPVSGRMGFSLYPPIPRDTVTLKLGLDRYVTDAAREEAAVALEDAIARIAEANGGTRMVRHVLGEIEAQVIEYEVYLALPSVRTLDSIAFAEAVRAELGALPQVRWSNFKARFGGGNDQVGLSIDITHRDREVLRRASEVLKDRLRSYDGVKSVYGGLHRGGDEISFRVTEAGRAMGFTSAEVGAQVRAAFTGVEALRQQSDGEELRIRVILPPKERRSIYALRNLVLRAPDGAEAPLYAIADVLEGRSEGEIQRIDGRPRAQVNGQIAPPEFESTIARDLARTLLPAIEEDFPGLTTRLSGDEQTKRETLESLQITIGFALALMYGALAIPFRSWVQPAIVMAAIPFGFSGAVIGHLIMGMGLSVVSLFGVIALGGVVINAALVMIDYANKARAAGAGPQEAMMRAGQRRFRPILLTTLTTFGGLAPMIFETSVQARFLVPMAVSLGYGIVFATAIVLFLIPCLYMVLEDLRWLLNPRRAATAEG
ncbi:MAG: efflux RND transporter permease subunit [Pseudomonadota bacterium]